MKRAGAPTLGGEYFFLHDRHRAHRPAGHEREDALVHLRKLGGTAFVKPLSGSRGDFAQAVHDEASLLRYLGEVSQYYDAILIQPVVAGTEYRVFVLDDEVALYGAEISAVRPGRRRALRSASCWPRTMKACDPTVCRRFPSQTTASLDIVLPKGERWEIPGRMNLSAGGTMVLEAPRSEAAIALATKAVRALGLRVAAVDLFTDIGGEPDAMRVIEVNANPSIRLLEQSNRGDLILKIWHHTFSAMGLLGV